MDEKYEREIYRAMTEDNEVPDVVRKSLDTTYKVISKQNNSDGIDGRNIYRGMNKIMKRAIVVACCFIILGALATNTTVIATMKEFFNDKGIVKVFEEGLFHTNTSSITDENIRITLDSYFYDSNKMAFALQIKLDDFETLNTTESVLLDFRLRNGNGDYIAEFIPDTKPLKGESLHIVNSISVNDSINYSNGEVQLYIVLESMQGALPVLENAILDVESVKLFNNSGELTIIDGVWPLAIVDNDDSSVGSREYVEYIAQSKSADIEVLYAKASPSSLNISFALDTLLGNYNLFRMKLINGKGQEFEGQGFYVEEKSGQTIITTNFTVSSYDDADKYTLQVFKIGSQDDGVFKNILQDQEVYLIKK